MPFRLTQEFYDDLAARLRRLMLDDRPYRSASLSRETVARMLGTKAEHVSTALGGKPFSEYLCDFRMKDFIDLMDAHPDMAVDTAALKAGFGTRWSFIKHWRERYGGHPLKRYPGHALSEKKRGPGPDSRYRRGAAT